MSQFYDDADRVVALAGIFQAAGLVRDIANKGLCGAQAEQVSLRSLFTFDVPTSIAVFGDVPDIRYGLETLYMQLEEPQKRDLEIAQYVVSLVHLADKALKNSKLLDTIGDALRVVQTNQNNQILQDTDLPEQLAEIYQQHISVLEPKIMVKGKPLYLENTNNAARIRSLLLAGFRAAIMWRQCGGKKMHLLFLRNRIAVTTRRFLQQI